MAILPKVIYIVLPLKIPMTFFTELGKNPTIHMETNKQTKNQIAKAILSKKSNAEAIKVTNFILFYRTKVTISMVLEQKQIRRAME
jgi:hypothetical protein